MDIEMDRESNINIKLNNTKISKINKKKNLSKNKKCIITEKKLKKETIIKEDGRYIIYYSF